MKRKTQMFTQNVNQVSFCSQAATFPRAHISLQVNTPFQECTTIQLFNQFITKTGPVANPNINLSEVTGPNRSLFHKSKVTEMDMGISFAVLLLTPDAQLAQGTQISFLSYLIHSQISRQTHSTHTFYERVEARGTIQTRSQTYSKNVLLGEPMMRTQYSGGTLIQLHENYRIGNISKTIQDLSKIKALISLI